MLIPEPSLRAFATSTDRDTRSSGAVSVMFQSTFPASSLDRSSKSFDQPVQAHPFVDDDARELGVHRRVLRALLQQDLRGVDDCDQRRSRISWDTVLTKSDFMRSSSCSPRDVSRSRYTPPARRCGPRSRPSSSGTSRRRAEFLRAVMRFPTRLDKAPAGSLSSRSCAHRVVLETHQLADGPRRRCCGHGTRRCARPPR